MSVANKTQYYINELRKVLSPSETELYGLVYEYNIEPTTTYAKINLPLDTLRCLIVYVEEIAYELTSVSSYSLGEEEVLELINRFYAPVTRLSEEEVFGEEYLKIDLYWNWEALSHISFTKLVPEVYKEGLREYIAELSIKNGWCA